MSDDPAAALAEVSRDLGLETPLTDLSDETQERRLVLSARLQIARARQQLLASMVMLGINRIVVTDGLIHAKVVFDMAARDTASRTSRASLYDSEATKSRTKAKASYGAWWFSPVKASVSHDTTTEHTTTVESSVDETSESRAELKAKLTGEVRVNFVEGA
jgi:hypothetical protein